MHEGTNTLIIRLIITGPKAKYKLRRSGSMAVIELLPLQATEVPWLHFSYYLLTVASERVISVLS